MTRGSVRVQVSEAKRVPAPGGQWGSRVIFPGEDSRRSAALFWAIEQLVQREGVTLTRRDNMIFIQGTKTQSETFTDIVTTALWAAGYEVTE